MTQAQPQDAISVHEIHNLVQALPKMDPVVLPDVAGYGRAGEWLLWLARAQGVKPQVDRVRLAVFAGSHGCHTGSIEETRKLIAPLAGADDAVVRVLQQVDADLRLYELDLDHPTEDFTKGPAIDLDAAAHAMAYGMMAVEPGLHLLALAGIGAGGEAAHKALLAELPKSEDALATLAAHGGMETCAMLGAILAARLAKVPVLLDGLAAEAAAAVLARMSADATLHCASAQALEPDLVDKAGLAGALGLVRLRALAQLA